MFNKLMEPDSILNRICDVIIGVFLTGLFTFICSIPVFTMGTALTAGYYTTAKVVRHHEGYVWTEYFRSFGRNFKAGTVIGFGYLAAALILVFDYVYLMNGEDETSYIMKLVIISVGIVFLVTFFFVFFELSRFDRKPFEIFKMGFITAFKHFPSSLGIAVMFLLAVYLVYLMPWGFCLYPGLALFGATFLMERVMRKYMPVPEEGSQEAEKWYYKQ